MKFANSVVVVICLVVIVALTLFLSSLTKSEILLSFSSSNAYAQQSSIVLQNKQKQQHPNIVLFLVDNEPNKALGTYGGLGAQTPNADKFAKEGIKFTRAYATNTYCSPTRASLMTGLMPSQHWQDFKVL
jgi:hypothetical protein